MGGGARTHARVLVCLVQGWRPGRHAAPRNTHTLTHTPTYPTKHTHPPGAKKIPIKGVTSFQPGPGPAPVLAAFIAEAKGQPAVATVIDYGGDEPATISRKSFYRATGWSGVRVCVWGALWVCAAVAAQHA